MAQHFATSSADPAIHPIRRPGSPKGLENVPTLIPVLRWGLGGPEGPPVLRWGLGGPEGPPLLRWGLGGPEGPPLLRWGLGGPEGPPPVMSRIGGASGSPPGISSHRYASSERMRAPAETAIAAIRSRSARESIAPVGLCGVLITMSRVSEVVSRSSSSRSYR